MALVVAGQEHDAGLAEVWQAPTPNEEINLLYTISEILGRTVALEEAAQRILTEISETVGARKAVMLVHDATNRQLNAVATLGVPLDKVSSISVDDSDSVSARVFRTSHPLIVEPDQMIWDGEQAFRKGAMLSVPIMWTSPRGGAEPLGVVNLSDRDGKPRIRLMVDSLGTPSLEFLDATGRVTSRLPDAR